MWIIWQELQAIMSDVWSAIVSGYRSLLSECQALLAKIAANYPLIIVTVVGLAISLPLMGIPLVAVFLFVAGASFNWFLDPKIQVEGSFIAYAIMFSVGVCVFCLMIDLGGRVEKRMQGKPKDDDQPSPTSESEAQ